MAVRKPAEKSAEKNPPAFTKAQLLESKRYRDRRDLLNALLQDGETYTAEQADTMITGFMKGKVK